MKQLSKALLHVFNLHRGGHPPAKDKVYRAIALLVTMFIRMDEILNQHPSHVYPRLPREAADSFKEACFSSMALLNMIAAYYMTNIVYVNKEPVQLFDVTIKARCMVHIALTAGVLNPRLSICYGGEDYVGRMKKIVIASVRGAKGSLVGTKVLDRLFLAWHLANRGGVTMRG